MTTAGPQRCDLARKLIAGATQSAAHSVKRVNNQLDAVRVRQGRNAEHPDLPRLLSFSTRPASRPARCGAPPVSQCSSANSLTEAPPDCTTEVRQAVTASLERTPISPASRHPTKEMTSCPIPDDPGTRARSGRRFATSAAASL